MRAYYVRVRRSQGIDDATIAVELGQGSGPGLVVRTYGERLAILGGDGLYDWLPADGKPCWDRLRAPANVIQSWQTTGQSAASGDPGWAISCPRRTLPAPRSTRR